MFTLIFLCTCLVLKLIHFTEFTFINIPCIFPCSMCTTLVFLFIMHLFIGSVFGCSLCEDLSVVLYVCSLHRNMSINLFYYAVYCFSVCSRYKFNHIFIAHADLNRMCWKYKNCGIFDKRRSIFQSIQFKLNWSLQVSNILPWSIIF